MIEQIAKRLKLLRNALDITAEDVAFQINYSANQIWRVEAGTCKPNIEFVAKMCKVYAVSIDLLVYGSDKEFQMLINKIYSKTA
ncbi:helix-turn-helix transcriptional regulator [Solibacillus sp. A46]|uniref:Helix-turn-helix transcriptional regulator n=1 Tax=Solibacillus faecavium TaxID=2762221 RepID=A0ABR8XYV0_9BACL|nr:helix-turn-helix transcriptional regulator [Solibacillus faecavium]MBD8037110.1 helix-turn-helix transcriptional regulator [Solibacillus faecavium]